MITCFFFSFSNFIFVLPVYKILYNIMLQMRKSEDPLLLHVGKFVTHLLKYLLRQHHPPPPHPHPIICNGPKPPNAPYLCLTLMTSMRSSYMQSSTKCVNPFVTGGCTYGVHSTLFPTKYRLIKATIHQSLK